MAAHVNVSGAAESARAGKIREGDWVYRRIKHLEAAVLPQLDGIVYVSKFIERAIAEEIPRVRDVPSIVAPNFVFPPAANEAPTNVADLIAIGTLEPRKNQAYLLQVLAEARRIGRSFTLTIVGSGQDQRPLQQLARELGVHAQVRFLGWQPDAPRLLAGHRALVHAAIMESFGLVLIEAMAAGLPVVAAPVGGIPEVFSDQVEGRYWPLDNPTRAAQILSEVVDNPVAHARYAQAARQRYQDAFQPASGAAQLTEFIRAIART